MAILALSDFEKRPYRIPNQEESKDLLSFIEATEETVLREILGTTTYEDFIAGLAEGSPLDKWTRLRDGYNYTYNDIDYKYFGIKKLLVARVYSEWLRVTRDKFTDIGLVINTSENNERVSHSQRIIDAYNDFARQVGGYYHQKNTMYGFMMANEADYPDWEFEDPERQNDFGL